MNQFPFPRRWLGLLLVILLLLLGGSTVGAHGTLVEAIPEPGQELFQALPNEVRLRFSQELSEASIIVTDSDFRQVQAGETRVDPDNPRIVFVPLQELAGGNYTVNWRTASVDGHEMQGSYEFRVNLETPPAATFTRVVAVIVFVAMGVLVYVRRARPENAQA